ncbi:MAG: glycosyltransferase [Vampirovibrionales bacterium]|nr:glycosyltransferase [Vampirovibrionales bacterium]
MILSANTGGGHGSAASALAESFTDLGALMGHQVRVQIAQVLENASLASRGMGEFYNFLLRHRQDWMHAYYWLVNHLRPNESRLLLNEAYGYTRQLFDKVCPSVLVSVHPMVQHLFAFTLKRLNLLDRVPLVSVVTDPYYGFWRGWACKDVAHYYVASQGAQQQLLEYGIAPEKITVAGMPIHERFRPVGPEDRQSIRRSLGLQRDRLSLFLNAGWAGGGNISKFLESISRLSSDDPLAKHLQLVFLAGRNEALRAQAEKLAAQSVLPIKVIGHTPHMHRLMQASDIMLSKVGGLTTFESMACELPMLVDCLTPPMPQEAHTARSIEATGAGICLHRPQDLLTTLRQLSAYPEQLGRMREATRRCHLPNAAQSIAGSVLSLVQPSLDA